MEWHQLEYFITIAREQHITRAAAQHAISQPALSRSIAKLEAELGFPLFDRCGRHIVLNQYGELFLQHVERGLQEIAQGQQLIRHMLHPDHGEVSLAFLHSLGVNMVPHLLSRFRSQQPQIQFKLSQNHTALLQQQLEAGLIDLCLYAPTAANSQLVHVPLFQEELFIAVPIDHPLARQKKIRLEQIASEPIVTFKQDYGLRILCDDFFQQIGLTPQITFEGEDILTVAGLVEAKLGVALIPKHASMHLPGLTFLTVTTPVCTRTIELAWRKDRYMPPAVKKCKDFILASFPANTN